MKKPIAVFRYILSIHILALTVLTILRFILFFSNIEQISGVENPFPLISKAFLKGIQFDNVIACYIAILPVVTLFIVALFNKIPRLLIKSFNIYYIISYTAIFAISVADIPYFSYYFTHLNNSIFNWFGFGGTAGMILQETSYYIFFALFLLVVISFAFLVHRIGNTLLKQPYGNISKKNYKYYIPFVLLVWGLCFVGFRGLGRYPIRVSDAYFCNNSFINQLGINPTFFLIKSSSQAKKQNKLANLISVEEAIAYVQNSFTIDSLPTEKSPISRNVNFEEEPKNYNIVIILLESMGVNYLEMEYKGKTLTPYIHELIAESYYFENFYSAGIHTNNGIASTLYGFPPIFEQTMMLSTPNYYRGLPTVLKSIGYQNLFFLTHDPSYDNMYAFLSENSFDKIYAEPDYPTEKIVNNFGVQDDYLFEFGSNKLNEIAKQNKPFLATFMTVSNHPPYVVPNKFKDAGATDNERIIAFTDNSLRVFMENAKKQDWYNNTIFVILGDHGRVLGKQHYEMSLSYNHIPLIIHSPLFKDSPKRIKDFGGQIDIFPTVMGLLSQPYVNNSLGIDLFREKRPYTYFVSDTHLGCIDNEFFYIYNPIDKNEGLYHYRENDTNNLLQEKKEVAKDMKEYSTSMMITADYLIQEQLTR